MTVTDIVERYLEDSDFESARDALHLLGPEAASEILAMATAPRARARGLLVMVLADRGYPPALPHMRRWLEDPDLEAIALPAGFALARYAPANRFATDELYRVGVTRARAMLREIADWWDSNDVPIPSETEWIAQQR